MGIPNTSDIVEDMLKNGKFNEITKILISSIDSITTDPFKLYIVVYMSYKFRDNFVGWNRIIDMVAKYYKQYNYNVEHPFYYENLNNFKIKEI